MKYIGFYSKKYSKYSNSVLSAVNKMDYIADCIIENGVNVEFISFANSCNDKDESNKTLGENRNIFYFKSLFPNSNILYRFVNRNIVLIKAFFWLLFNIRVNETIIVYHSINYWFLFLLLRKIKSFRIILEVEEIYTDVSKNNFMRRWIEKSMFELADAFIFSTEGLNNIVNKFNKPYLIINGRYKFEDSNNIYFEDNVIHAVYAGILDIRKGCIEAINSSQYLDSKYHIHILGFGKEEEVDSVKRAIEDVRKKTECKVTYDGILTGENFTRFMQSCHIGLCTQDPDSKFNATSFPSKVLTYLCCGLGVVAINIPAIKESQVSSLVTFYDHQDSLSIARAIKAAKISKEHIKIKIDYLHKKFVSDLKELL